MSTLIINILACIIIELVYLIITLVIGIPMIGGFKLNIYELILVLFEALMIIIAYTAIFTFVSLAFSEVALSTSAGILIALVMYIGANTLSIRANEEPYFYSKTYMDGKLVEREPHGENPRYPGDDVINFYKNILYVIPQGQASIIFNKVRNINIGYYEEEMEYDHIKLLLSSSRSYNTIYYGRNNLF